MELMLGSQAEQKQSLKTLAFRNSIAVSATGKRPA
jgi:hypothetical protein